MLKLYFKSSNKRLVTNVREKNSNKHEQKIMLNIKL